jgi:hypothetical protein
MVGGSNTNIRYRDRMYHVQTEDGGEESPNIITLLYQGGAILFSKKRSYQEWVGQPEQESMVRQIMEEQHRLMVSALKAGKLDERLGLEAGAEAGPEDDTSTVEFGAGLISDRSLDQVIEAFLVG